MNNLSKERLADIANLKSPNGMIFPASHEECAAMAAELLARREAAEKPVGTFIKGSCGYFPSFHEDAVQLFTAPPLPVVPDEITYEQACLEVTKLSPAEAYMKAWSARSAMLNHIAIAGNMVNYPGLPDGWALVPITPTDEMRDAWFFMEDFDTEWSAMLAATPKPE